MDEEIVEGDNTDVLTAIVDPIMRSKGACYLQDIDGVVDKSSPLESQALDLHQSLTNIVDQAQRLGFTHQQLDAYLIMFVKSYCTESWGAVRRLTGRALFSSILGLNNFNSLVGKLLRKLGEVTREPDSGPEVALGAVRSIATELHR